MMKNYLFRSREVLREENLRYVLECHYPHKQEVEHCWVYELEDLFHVKMGKWPLRTCDSSVKTDEQLEHWVKKSFLASGIRFIPREELAKERILRKDENEALLLKSQSKVVPDVRSTKQEFMSRLPNGKARIVGAASVLWFRSPSTNIRWGTKKRSS